MRSVLICGVTVILMCLCTHSVTRLVNITIILIFIDMNLIMFNNAFIFWLYLVFLVNLVSVAAVDGTTVEFRFTANNTDQIVYRVNGTSEHSSCSN